MGLLSEELERRRRLVNELRYNDTTPRLFGLLQWFREQPPIMRIINDVKIQVDVGDLLRHCNRRSPPPVKTPEDQAAVGIYLIEQCAGGRSIDELTYSLGIAPTHDTNSRQAWTDEAVSRFIVPALDFIEDHLREVESAASVEEFVKIRIDWLGSTTFSDRFPETAQSLDGISKQFAIARETGQWFNVGNSCREAFKTFATEVTVDTNLDLPPGTKAGDVKATLRRAIANDADKSRFGKTLEKLVAATWDHAQSITHRKTTTRLDAERLYLLTTLALWEVIEHLSKER